MKQFKFGLEVILKLRQNREEEARIQLGRATAESQRLRREMSNRHQLLATTGAACCPGDFQAVEFYRNRLAIEMERLEVDLFENEKRREEAKDKYIHAMSQLQVYKKLKERRYKEYRKAVSREESKLLDEMNQIRQNRKEMVYGR